ncbi:MAG TPA: LPP20 family lipoprotein [Desulfatiglandales bacterium]|nr:LPP20 family lipoprotein [Desulfatiglandales bacterium]
MKGQGIKILCVLLGVGILFSMGCAGKKPGVPAGPPWVYKGSGAFDVDKGKLFYGVGVASGIKNKALLISTADNRARAEIAKILETYVAVLAKDYMASTTAGDMSASAEEQHVEQALKTFTKTTLHGARIIDHWQDPADGSYYALCEMDLFAFKNALEEHKELDAKVRDYVRQNAEKLHGQLEDMEQSR